MPKLEGNHKKWQILNDVALSVNCLLLVKEGDWQCSESLWSSLFDTVRGSMRGLTRTHSTGDSMPPDLDRPYHHCLSHCGRGDPLWEHYSSPPPLCQALDTLAHPPIHLHTDPHIARQWAVLGLRLSFAHNSTSSNSLLRMARRIGRWS